MEDKFKVWVQKHYGGQYILGISVFNSWNHIGIFFDFVFFRIVVEYYKRAHFGYWA